MTTCMRDSMCRPSSSRFVTTPPNFCHRCRPQLLSKNSGQSWLHSEFASNKCTHRLWTRLCRVACWDRWNTTTSRTLEASLRQCKQPPFSAPKNVRPFLRPLSFLLTIAPVRDPVVRAWGLHEWGQRGWEQLGREQRGWAQLDKVPPLHPRPLSLSPSLPLSLSPSFPRSLVPFSPLSLPPSLPLSLFPSFPVSLQHLTSASAILLPPRASAPSLALCSAPTQSR
eukprot:378848-Rhodomonas_salina.1